MRPIVFGYLSVPPRTSPRELERWRRAIEEFAERENFDLNGVFTDPRGRAEGGFYALVEALRRDHAVAVVVPTVEHLGYVSATFGADRRTITRFLRVRILTLPDVTPPGVSA